MSYGGAPVAMRAENRATGEAYGAAQITVLEGLEPVRKRPGMYIGSTGPSGLHHLVWEVVDNSVDEAMAGYCDRIDVTLLADGGCRVVDDGRGIPVDPNPQYKDKSGAEVALTKLHAGGKFGGGGYKVSGRPARRGRQVVNALSRRLVSRSTGTASTTGWSSPTAASCVTKLDVTGPGAPGPHRHHRDVLAGRHRSSTRSSCRPGPSSSGSSSTPSSTRAWRSASATSAPATSTPRRSSTRAASSTSSATSTPPRSRCSSRWPASRWPRRTAEVEVAMQWNTGYYEGIHGFANGIATTEGGMHEEGFKKALTAVVNKYARAKSLLKEKDDNLLGEDIREGLTAIVSVRLSDPQFEGQTKAKLGNVSHALAGRDGPPTRSWPSGWRRTRPRPRPIVNKAVQASRARVAAKQARDATRRKSALEGAGLPGKLTDCADQELRRGRAVHRRGRLGRRLGHPGPQPASTRRSCPSGARSSTSSGPASTGCSRTPRSRR